MNNQGDTGETEDKALIERISNKLVLTLYYQQLNGNMEASRHIDAFVKERNCCDNYHLVASTEQPGNGDMAVFCCKNCLSHWLIEYYKDVAGNADFRIIKERLTAMEQDWRPKETMPEDYYAG